MKKQNQFAPTLKGVAPLPKGSYFPCLIYARDLRLSLGKGILFLLLLLPLCPGIIFSQNSRLWATYYGGTSYDGGYSVATDVSGNVYLTGYTYSSTGIASGGFQNIYGGGIDAFLVKFSATGGRLWATYYGGAEDDVGYSMSTDAAGNVYLAGRTFSSAGIASGGFKNTYSSGSDAFLVKFNSSGSRLWATYYGAGGVDDGYSVATDAVGNVYLAGKTGSTSGIASGGFQNTIGSVVASDAFLVKFNSAGGRLWATYYGGTGDDMGYSTATDATGNVYLAGKTENPSGIASGGFQNTYGGGLYDAFLVKFSTSGGRLWATYYGGTGFEGAGLNGPGISVAADASGNVYLGGITDSPTSIASGGFQNTIGGGMAEDAFLVKFSTSGGRLWATYYGGTGGEDIIGNIAADASGNVYLGGITYSAAGIAFGGFQNNIVGMEVPFVVKFNAGGIRLCATYYGHAHDETGVYIAVDGLGNVYLAAFTDTVGYASGGFQNTFGGGYDAYLVKFTSCFWVPPVLNATATSTNVLCNGQCTGTAAASASGGSPSYTYAWSPSGGSASFATGLCAGTYTVTVTDTIPTTVTATVTITQPTALTATVTSTPAACGSNSGSATVNAGGGTPGYTYSWSNGQSSQTATGLGAGNYTATVTDANGCIQTQTVTVISNNTLSVTVSSTQTGCTVNNGTATATPLNGTAPYTYLWSNGGTTSQISNLTSQIYSVTVTDASGCTQTQTVNVTQIAGPTATASASPNTIPIGASTTLTASGGGTYSWSPSTGLSCVSCFNPTAFPSSTTVYCVTVTDSNGCSDSVCITVLVELDCSNLGELYLPNAFSPNGDGENDVLQIYYGNILCIKTFKLVIYNRWGEKVFETTNPTAEWDGSYKGKIEGTALASPKRFAKASVFVYYLKATFTNGEKINRKGNVSLVR